MTGRMGFIGVSTAASSINAVFPRWAEILGLPTRTLVGHDVALGAGDEVYRALVREIAEDPDHLGALVTTHKIRLFEATHDLFDELDVFARACGEISSISKVDGRLVGHAKDPLTVGLALDDLLPAAWFAENRDVLILGAGGSGTALAWHLGGRADRPERVLVTDTSPERLAHLEEVLARGQRTEGLRTVLVDEPGDTDRMLAGVPNGSLVVNATGLGKDRPGSPLSDRARFPRGSIAWEFNYRGSLEFLHQARKREELDELTVVDGWRYFIHGWSQVVAEVFRFDLTPQTVEELAASASAVR